MRASEVEHQISVRIDWQRHAWHRVMAMWTTNSTDNQDRLRLFVDGAERGTIKYGTGLIYGSGVIYGQEEVTPGSNRYIVDNIDLTDTFPRIFIGSDIYGVQGARALLDNIRFSNIERLESIRITSSGTIDTSFVGNDELENPAVEDIYTTHLLDFNSSDTEVEDFATLLNAERGIFRWECKVIDSFNRVKGDVFLEALLEKLIDRLKGAHTECFFSIVE
jgi:hypothetical protein